MQWVAAAAAGTCLGMAVAESIGFAVDVDDTLEEHSVAEIACTDVASAEERDTVAVLPSDTVGSDHHSLAVQQSVAGEAENREMVAGTVGVSGRTQKASHFGVERLPRM